MKIDRLGRVFVLVNTIKYKVEWEMATKINQLGENCKIDKKLYDKDARENIADVAINANELYLRNRKFMAEAERIDEAVLDKCLALVIAGENLLNVFELSDKFIESLGKLIRGYQQGMSLVEVASQHNINLRAVEQAVEGLNAHLERCLKEVTS